MRKQGIPSRFRREEIPSGLGIALVGLFVFGLTAVAWSSIRQSERASQVTWRQTAEYSLKLLATVLSQSPDPEYWNKELRNFANQNSCHSARLIDPTGLTLASLDPTEIGSRAATTLAPESAPQGDTAEDWKAKYPVTLKSPAAKDHSEETGPAFASVQVEFVPPQLGTLSSTNYAWVMGVILVCTVLLGVLYRRLRVHLHAVHRITERLFAFARQSHFESGSVPAVGAADSGATSGRSATAPLLEFDLSNLRISDEAGAVTHSWNQLIELAEELRNTALRANAANDLQRVLEQRGAGGDLAAALVGLPEGLLLIDRDRRVSFFNEAVGRLMGFGDQTADGSRLDELTLSHLGRRIASLVSNAISGTSSESDYSAATEVLSDDSDGSTYRVRVLPVKVTGQSCGAIIMVSDISQQIRADRAREDFVSQVTHELRTPLTNIRAYAETLSSGMFDDPQVVTECYNVITKETRRLSRLIEDILSVSQLEVGSMELVIDDLDLRTLLTDTVRDFRGQAEEKRMDLQLTLPAKLPPFRGDRDKLLVIFNNLLGNALKYTPAGGRVEITAQVAGSSIQVRVKDSGIGIDPEDHDRIFEKFQRSRDPEVLAQTGTGIGLTTAREIAQRHGGNITLESAKGKGSTFILSLPLSGAPKGVNVKPREEVGLRNRMTESKPA